MTDIFKNLSRLSKQGKMYLDNRLKEFGINSGQFYYILIICDNEGISQDKLSSIVRVHPSNITRALEILQKKEYIVKKDSEDDHRTCKLFPTQKAKDIYHNLVGFREDWISIITQDFSDIERECLDKLLKKADANLIRYLNP